MATCIPVGVVKVSVVREMEAYDLLYTMFERTNGHLSVVIIVITHESQGTLELHCFVSRGNTPDDRE
jgi:hypothetical protein